MGSLTSDPPAVSATGLAFRYRSGRPGLGGIDLEVRAGEVVVVLGPNGSGKSTLLRLLATDLRPEGGGLALWGQPLPPRRAGDLVPLRRRIGYAPDSPLHVEALTGQENALLFWELAGRPRSEAPARLAPLLRRFRLDEVAAVPVSQYSFGMKRKLLLVEALAPAPDLLLLDEPAVGLDPEGMEALSGTLRARAAAGGAVVVATNETRELPGLADRVVFLHRGGVVEDAPLAELLRRLRGRTRIEIEHAGQGTRGHAPDLGSFDGVEEVDTGPGSLVVRSSAGARPLPAILETLVAAGIDVRDVRVREPDLGDIFRALTGEALTGEPPKG